MDSKNRALALWVEWGPCDRTLVVLCLVSRVTGRVVCGHFFAGNRQREGRGCRRKV